MDHLVLHHVCCSRSLDMEVGLYVLLCPDQQLWRRHPQYLDDVMFVVMISFLLDLILYDWTVLITSWGRNMD